MSEINSCLTCKFYMDLNQCIAYPKEIPKDILLGIEDHKTPFKGDHGIQYKPLVSSNGQIDALSFEEVLKFYESQG